MRLPRWTAPPECDSSSFMSPSRCLPIFISSVRIFTLGDFNPVTFVSGGGPALSTHVLATLSIRDAFEIGRPDLGVAAVMSALPLMVPMVIQLMRKLRTTEVQL